MRIALRLNQDAQSCFALNLLRPLLGQRPVAVLQSERVGGPVGGRVAELARLRFEGVVADFLQLLDAERSMPAAQDQLAQGRTEGVTCRGRERRLTQSCSDWCDRRRGYVRYAMS